MRFLYRILGRWRQTRRVRRLLDELFADDEIIGPTSLRPAHRTRADLREVELDDDGETIRAISFTILRHPRPYAFSGQHHEVMELYRWDLAGRCVTVERSVNLTRLRGRDGEGYV